MRGLDVLRTLSRLELASAAQIGARVGVPRPTVHRLLMSLADQGYVRRIGESDLFTPTAQTVGLSRGWNERTMAIELTSQLIDEAADALRWPLALMMLAGGSVVVCHSTHERSPWSLLPSSPVGRRIPLHGTAPGRIFLALMPDEERARLLERSGDEERGIVEAAARRGYAYRDGGLLPRTVSVAVGIRSGGVPLLCVCASFIRAAKPLAAAVRDHLGTLRAIAVQAEQALVERSGSIGGG